jgi:uncharacterized membrane protein
MTRFQFSVLVLAILWIGFGASLLGAVPMLPPRMATHFDGAGNPNGWMSRSAHLIFMGAFGIGFPLFIIGMCWMARYLPLSAINLPHREYWLASERRDESTDYLFRHSIWLACLGIAFITGLHWAVVFGNQRQPASLPLTWVLSVVGPFLIGVVAWIAFLYRRFRRPNSQPSKHIAPAL